MQCETYNRGNAISLDFCFFLAMKRRESRTLIYIDYSSKSSIKNARVKMIDLNRYLTAINVLVYRVCFL